MNIERVAPASKAVIVLLCASVICAALSAGLHTHFHQPSHFFLRCAVVLGFFALLKMANQVCSGFFGERVIHWIHAMTFEMLAILAITVLRLLRLSAPKTVVTGSQNVPGKPILLIHGYCNDSSVWAYMRRKLAQEIASPIYTIDLGYPFYSMHDYAEKVRARIAEIRKETGSSDVILVGHSMGGVISSLVAMKEAPSISTVFTIGAPLCGTRLAKVGVGLNAREMEISSPLLFELNAQLRGAKEIRFYHIGTKTDQMVIPCSSALLGCCPEREFLFEDVGHVSLLFSPRVARVLLHWLREQSQFSQR